MKRLKDKTPITQVKSFARYQAAIFSRDLESLMQVLDESVGALRGKRGLAFSA